MTSTPDWAGDLKARIAELLPAVAASGSFAFSGAADGTWFTLTDAEGTSVTFEWDPASDGVTAGRTAIVPSPLTLQGAADTARAVINASALRMTAAAPTVVGAGFIMTITQDDAGAAGNTAIASSGQATGSFSGGLDVRFPAADTFIGKELLVGGAYADGRAVAERALFIKLVDDVPLDYDEAGSVREPTFQLKHRADRTVDGDAAAALLRMTQLFDRMRSVSPRSFTGAVSGREYVEAWPRTGPRLLEEHYVVMDVTVALDDP